MFDKNIAVYSRSTPYEKSVTIHEHRAPTDASVQIMKEMEREMRSKVLWSGVIKSSSVEAAVVIFDDPMRMLKTVAVKVKINEIESRVEKSIDEFQGIESAIGVIVSAATEAVTEAIITKGDFLRALSSLAKEKRE